MALILVMAFVVLVAVLAPLVGADSRDGRDWQARPTRLRAWSAERGAAVRDFWSRQDGLWRASQASPWQQEGPLRWHRDGARLTLDGATVPQPRGGGRRRAAARRKQRRGGDSCSSTR